MYSSKQHIRMGAELAAQAVGWQRMALGSTLPL